MFIFLSHLVFLWLYYYILDVGFDDFLVFVIGNLFSLSFESVISSWSSVVVFISVNDWLCVKSSSEALYTVLDSWVSV